jgi:hypothetical protein
MLQYATGVYCRSYGDGANIDATKLTTNAARMRAGLPPLKPRNLNIPSRVQAGVRAPNPWPSMVYPNTVTGYIQVNRVKDGKLEGYVKKGCSTSNFLGLTRDYESRMAITFTPSNPFNIAINNHQGRYKYLGFAGDNLTGNRPYYMVETNPTSPKSRPSPVGNSLNSKMVPNSESAIWYYDSQSRRFSLKWINPDGSSISPFLWFYPSSDALAIVAYQTGQPSNSYEVYYTVVFS